MPSALKKLCNNTRYFLRVLLFFELVADDGPGRGRMRGSKRNKNGKIEENIKSLDLSPN